MVEYSKLQLAKELIELSILLSPQKEFLLPMLDKDNSYHQNLYKAAYELKNSDLVSIILSSEGKIILKKKLSNE